MMNKKYVFGIILVIAISGAVLLFTSKKDTEPAVQGNSKIKVVASFYPLYYFASEIGKDMADVKNITPSGAEPHDYEPTPGDIAEIESSDILVLNGGQLEAWGDNIRKNIDPNQVVVITAGENLTTQEVVEDGEKITDPHIWLSPLLAEKMVNKIKDGFISKDPANASYYESNASALNAKLARLDTEYSEGLSSCLDKDIVTSHAAFGYLAAAYHLNQVPITGLSPDAEPSPKQLADIARFAKENKVKYIFFESLVSPKLSETVAEEIGAKTLVLNPIEGLSESELAQGKNYVSEMENNLTNLKIALQCK